MANGLSEILPQTKSKNPFETYKATRAIRDDYAQTVSSRISRVESNFNDSLQLPWETFKQQNPNTLFADANEYQEFKNNYDYRKPSVVDFVQAYGQAEGLNTALNVTGIAPAWLGASADEVRELDINTAKWNPEANGFDLQVRVADKKNNRSYTAPLTRFGETVKSLFGMGGDKAVEEAEIKTIDLVTLDKMYQGFKIGTQDILKDPGFENLQGNPNAESSKKLSFFDSSAPARGQKEDWLLSEATDVVSSLAGGGQETPSSTDTQQPTTETAAAPVGEVQTLSQEVIDLGKQTFGLREGDKGILRKPKDVKAFNDAVGPDFYLSPNFQFTEEQEASLTPADKERILGRLKEKSDGNINISLAQIELQTKAAVQDINKQPGVTTDEVKAKKDVADFYSTFRSDLSSIFKANQSLYEEYKADPEAFANKYKNNINAIKGTPVSSTDKKELIEGSPFKLNDKDLNALNNAIKTNNLTEFTNILDRLTKGGEVSEEQQQRIVSFLGKTNNFVRTTGQRQLNQSLVMDMWASMGPEMHDKYAPALLRYAETGYLTFEGLEQQRKIAADQKSIELSPVGTKLLNLVPTFTSPDYQFNPRDAEQIAAFGQQIGNNQKDYEALLSTSGIYLKRAIEEKGSPGLLQRVLSFGQAKGPAASGFTLGPNVVALDAQNNYTDDPAAADKFRVRDPGGRGFVGGVITKNELLDLIGPEGIAMLMGVSAENAKRNPELKGGG